jgi:hypothetical protein
MCAKCRTHDAFHAVGRGRFNRQFAASRFQPLDHRLYLAASFAGDMIAQPLGQHLRVRDRSLPESKPGSNLGVQSLSGAPGEECFAIHRNRNIELLAQCDYSLLLDFGFVPGKPAAITEERQQDCEAKSARPALVITRS